MLRKILLSFIVIVMLMTTGSLIYAAEPDSAIFTKVEASAKPPYTYIYSLKPTGTNQVRITWRKVSGVDGYQIKYGTKSNLSDGKYAAINGGEKNNYTRKDLIGGRTYYARLRAFRMVNGKRVYAASWSTLKSCYLPAAPSQVSFESLTSVNPGEMKIVVKSGTGVGGYQIAIADNSQMKNAITASWNGNKGRTYVRKGLKEGNTYYVRVRAFIETNGKKFYSIWSAIKSVRISKEENGSVYPARFVGKTYCLYSGAYGYFEIKLNADGSFYFMESAGRYGYSEWNYTVNVKKTSSTTYELLIKGYRSAGVNVFGTPEFIKTGETWTLTLPEGNSADSITLNNTKRLYPAVFRLK